MSNQYLLDASALLALLQGETGSEMVIQLLPNSAISSVNLAETASVLNKLGMPEKEMTTLFNEIDLDVVAFSKEIAIMTGGIRGLTSTQGLSLGDRSCLATAKHHKRIAITADKAWEHFKNDIGVEIEFIR